MLYFTNYRVLNKSIREIFKMVKKSIPGFTLLELMIAVAIVAVLVSIAIPNISSTLPKIRLKSAARDLVSNLQKLRMEAVKENQSSRLVFDSGVSPGRYFFDSNSSGALDPGEVMVALVSYKSGIDFGLGATGGNNWDSGPCIQVPFITFSSRGTANSGTVYLDNRNKDICYAVTILTTGSINIRQFNGTQWE